MMLTLQGRTFENNIRPYVSVSGVSGVSIGDVKRLSDTEISVRLEFNGVLNRDGTLTFEVGSGGIKNYVGFALTEEIRVTATVESLTATHTGPPLTEATLHNSTVTLTLRGRTFENNIRSYLSVSGISGVTVGNIRLLSNTEVEVRLQFSGSFDSDRTLTFTVRSGGIKNYNGSNLTTTLSVSAVAETQTPVVETQPPVVETQTPVVTEEWIENTVVNQTSEDIYVIYSTWAGQNNNIPAGYVIRGYYRTAPGEQRSFYAWSNNNIHFRITKSGEAIKPNSSTLTFPFWIHSTNAFSLVASQEIHSSIPKDALTYSDQARDELIHEDGFMEYPNGSQVRVTSAWVKVHVAGPVTTPNVVTTGSHPPIYWADSDAG